MSERRPGAIIRLLAETPVHVGIGQSTGALDLPVARERTTHYPVIPGSGVKGAFRVWAVEQSDLRDQEHALFGRAGSEDDGSDQGAGNLLCSDARLLLLPVRCLSDSFKWVTCPALLSRFIRDCRRSGIEINVVDINVAAYSYVGAQTSDTLLALEELEFAHTGEVDATVLDVLSTMLPHAEVKQRLVVLSDKDFTWFARYALPIMARNNLEEHTKVSKNLWYEETMPSDAVLYVLLGQRFKTSAHSVVTTAIKDAPYIQMGGNETVGQGWFSMKAFEGVSYE